MTAEITQVGRRVGLFGASGFVGRAIHDELVRQGLEPVPLRASRLAARARDLAGLTIEAAERVAGLDDELAMLEGLEIVINAAGLAWPESRLTDELVGANALWPAVLTIACNRYGVRRLVHISSAAVYGSQRVLDETLVPRPGTPYAMTKLWGDQLALAQRGRTEVVIYRPTSVHGDNRGLTARLREFSQSPFSSVAGNGSYPTPQVLVENVAAAATMLATIPETPDHPVLHPSEGMTTGELLLTLSAGRRPRRVPVSLARPILWAAKLVGRVHPWAGAQARRLEMVWFGQDQQRGWLDERGFRPARGWGRGAIPGGAGRTPRVLVLLAAYNGREYLDEQLASILDQEDVEVEVLIGVDASTDGTEELVARWVAREPRVRALPDGHSAGGAAKNFYRLITAARTAGFDLVGLADQDDVWLPGRLSWAVRELELHGASGYSSNAWIWYPHNDSRALLDKAQPQRRWDHLFSSAGPGSTYVLDVAAFDEFAAWLGSTPGIAAIDYHDWLVYAWFRQTGRKWIIDPTATVDYRQHDANQIGANRGPMALRERVRGVLGGWYSDQLVRVATAVGADDEPPVRLVASGRLIDRLRLLPKAGQLRRKRSERFALMALLVAEALVRHRPPTRPADPEHPTAESTPS